MSGEAGIYSHLPLIGFAGGALSPNFFRQGRPTGGQYGMSQSTHPGRKFAQGVFLEELLMELNLIACLVNHLPIVVIAEVRVWKEVVLNDQGTHYRRSLYVTRARCPLKGEMKI
jgi:hypothetical protein